MKPQGGTFACSLILVFMKRSKALLHIYKLNGWITSWSVCFLGVPDTPLRVCRTLYMSFGSQKYFKSTLLYFKNVTRTSDIRFLKGWSDLCLFHKSLCYNNEKVNNVILYELILWVKTWFRWEFRFFTLKHALTCVSKTQHSDVIVFQVLEGLTYNNLYACGKLYLPNC